MKERKAWVDGLRGLAMLLVMYGHICTGVRPYTIYSSTIKLPLFFAVTGYVFSDKNGDIRAFFRSLWKHLILPWLIFAVLYTIMKIAGGTAVRSALYDFFSGNVAWYIPCLIFAEILFFLIRRATKNKYLQGCVMLALAAAGYFIALPEGDIYDVFGRIFVVQFYILIGYIFRNLDVKIEKPRFWPAVFGLVYIAAGAYLLLFDGFFRMDVQSCSYSDPILCLLMTVGGCSFLFYYARFIRMPKWLVFIGRNTLVFYLFHSRILDMLKPFIRMIPSALRKSLMPGLPITLATLAVLCGLCTIFSLLINRYVPFLAGKPAKKR